jgi:hypothetical protein
MRILVDASKLGAAGPEERDFFRDVVRQLLGAGSGHSFGIVGWPRELRIDPAQFLSPLPVNAASWCVTSSVPGETRSPRPSVWYSPLGEIEHRGALDAGADGVHRIASCFRSADGRATRTGVEPDDRLWTVTVSRSTFRVLVEHEGHSVRRVRKVDLPALPHGLWTGERGDVAGSSGAPRPEAPYVLTTLSVLSEERFGGIVRGVLQHRSRRREDLRLLVLGRPTAGIRRAAWWAKLRGRIRFVGELPRRARATLLAGADAFVLSGGGDGSWIASREALAVGAPVLAPLESPVTEILGDAALYYAPSDPGDLAEALGRCRRCEALRRLLAQRGIQRARVGSLDRFVEGVLDVMAEAAAASAASGSLPGGPRKVLA